MSVLFRKKSIIIYLISAWVALSALLFQNCSDKKETDTGNTEALANAVYVGSASCAGCHADEHSEWLGSHHYMAMQPANDTTVAGDFNNAEYTADGITSRFYKKDGKFFINTDDENGINRDYEVKYIFGFTPLQQYLVEFPGGKMQVPRVSWDVIKGKWFHQYEGIKIPNHDWMHWSQNSQNWNTMCASCHSTNLQKNYDTETNTYHTTFSEVNVSCESCHGPGSAHIAFVNSSDYDKDKTQNNSYLKLGGAHEQTAIINNCAICHSRKTDITSAHPVSDNFLDDFIPQIPMNEFFYDDGQMQGEVYNYTSFLQSKMYRNNVMCTDCHNPHSGKLVKPGNLVCGKCHEPATYDNMKHTFHQEGSEGAQCKNCHMLTETYMGNDVRHDHSFRVPRPDLTVKYGTPNTCNRCHSDKSAQWATEAVEKWYGKGRKYHFAEDLIPGSRIDENSFTHLKKLLNDTAVPVIIQATAVHYLANIPTEDSYNSLIKSLSDSNALVRYHALRSLENFPVNLSIDKTAPLLNDPVRSVRISAALLLAGTDTNFIPDQYRNSFRLAFKEAEQYALYQSDFSVGNLTAADLYLKTKQYDRAIYFYKRGLMLDSLMNYARLNLSVAYNLEGKNDSSLQVLDEAIKTDPRNDRIYFNKALLLVEMNKTDEAIAAFEKAVQLRSPNPRVYYNYGLLLQDKNDMKGAESIFKKGLSVAPVNGDLNYALALLYINTNQNSKIREPITVLLMHHRDNPAYSELLKNFVRMN